MPYKDQFGIWRQDEPSGDNGIRLFVCPNCGGLLDYDCVEEDDEFDFDLANDWGFDYLPGRHDKLAQYLAYSCMYAICDDCDLSFPYGPDFYYNPDTNWYDLPRPLFQRDIPAAEYAAYRLQQEAAGQLSLFSEVER